MYPPRLLDLRGQLGEVEGQLGPEVERLLLLGQISELLEPRVLKRDWNAVFVGRLDLNLLTEQGFVAALGLDGEEAVQGGLLLFVQALPQLLHGLLQLLTLRGAEGDPDLGPDLVVELHGEVLGRQAEAEELDGRVVDDGGREVGADDLLDLGAEGGQLGRDLGRRAALVEEDLELAPYFGSG